jgi:hypothetical protein
MMKTTESKITDWLSPEWVPVKFITLTDKNGTEHSKHIEEVKRFFTVMSWVVGTHIRALVGGCSKWNTHSHAVLLIHISEMERYRRKASRFSRSRVWEWKTCNQKGFQDWNWELSGENGWKAFDYLMKCEHNYQAIFNFCPKKLSRCRRDDCEHHGTIHRKLP